MDGQTHLVRRDLETQVCFQGSIAQTDSQTPGSYRVQVDDDFPRLRLHLPDQVVCLDPIWRQDEAAQQTNLQEGHPGGIQTQTRDQPARGTGRMT